MGRPCRNRCVSAVCYGRTSVVCASVCRIIPWFVLPLSLSLSVFVFASLSLSLCPISLSLSLSRSLSLSLSVFVSLSLSLSPSSLPLPWMVACGCSVARDVCLFLCSVACNQVAFQFGSINQFVFRMAVRVGDDGWLPHEQRHPEVVSDCADCVWNKFGNFWTQRFRVTIGESQHGRAGASVLPIVATKSSPYNPFSIGCSCCNKCGNKSEDVYCPWTNMSVQSPSMIQVDNIRRHCQSKPHTEVVATFLRGSEETILIATGVRLAEEVCVPAAMNFVHAVNVCDTSSSFKDYTTFLSSHRLAESIISSFKSDSSPWTCNVARISPHSADVFSDVQRIAVRSDCVDNRYRNARCFFVFYFCICSSSLDFSVAVKLSHSHAFVPFP